jgi:DNA-binding beta-propeller fold protein YncE
LACAVALALAAPGAGAAEAPDHPMLGAITGERIGPLEQFKDACGVALDGHGDVYVADYYGNRVVVFSPGWGYLTQIDGIEPPDAAGVRPVDGPCALAVDPAGNLYVASYHGELRRYQPTVYPPGEGTGYGSGETVDPGPVTGVAVDPATGDLYVDRRT